MQLAFRWYGETDPVPVRHIAQIPGVRTVVASLYDVPPGVAWDREQVLAVKAAIEEVGLTFDIVESVPVHEDIKLGRDTRDDLFATYCRDLTLLGEVGVSVVAYNFIPLYDWLRTDLALELPDGSTALAYDESELPPEIDPWAEGWPAYPPRVEPIDDLRRAYRDMDKATLREHLVTFLEAIVPTAEAAGVRLAIHPDDPPWSVFGIPRVATDRDDLSFLLDAVPSPANGLTLCVGSLGASPTNDVVAMAAEFHDRTHFVHARNVAHVGPRHFHEVAHPPEYGDVDLVAVLGALHERGWSGFVRPDHGRMIWGEQGKPGYGLYDRALGASFLNGVWHGLDARP